VKALVAGIVAGYGIAVPVGPITLLIVDTAMRRGFRNAFAAALGAASADLVYASAAAVAGLALAARLEPYARSLRLAGAATLAAIALYRAVALLRARRNNVAPGGSRAARGWVRTFATYLGLTLTNPVTVAYFAALIVGLQGDTLAGGGAKATFVAGAFAASLSWQTLLAAAGGVLHRRLPSGAAFATGLAGSAIILGLAAALAVSA
jgi:arginine exporter protein ArgO